MSSAMAPAPHDVAEVSELLHALVRTADEIVALAEAGDLTEALVQVELRNRTFELAREALQTHQRGDPSSSSEAEVAVLMASARAGQDRLVSAMTAARERIRHEVAAMDRGASAANAYERAAERPAAPKIDARR